MKLDVNALRYLSKDEFRVLTAVEMGMRNHEIVPAELIDRIAGLKRGGAYKCMQTLLRHKLLHHESKKYDGYRLTPLGYDYLAIKVLCNRGFISGVGRQVGVGKESDIFEVENADGETMILKLHRLGRTSFRAVKSKRDYLGHRKSFNWLYLSRLAALKEFAFMQALHGRGYPVPKAIDNNRHAVLMSLVDGVPLYSVKSIENPKPVLEVCIAMLTRLVGHGLIHCDFNEFNLLINEETSEVTMIDFPQMVSTSHPNAEDYFNRDVQDPEEIPTLAKTEEKLNQEHKTLRAALDQSLQASGYNMTESDDLLERFVTGTRLDDDDDDDGGSGSASESGSEVGSVDKTDGSTDLKDEDIDANGQKEGLGSADEMGQISDDGGQFIEGDPERWIDPEEEDGESYRSSSTSAQKTIANKAVRNRVRQQRKKRETAQAFNKARRNAGKAKGKERNSVKSDSVWG